MDSCDEMSVFEESVIPCKIIACLTLCSKVSVT